jgi:hypothetical protein
LEEAARRGWPSRLRLTRTTVNSDRVHNSQQLVNDLVAEVVAFKHAHDLVDSQREVTLGFSRTELAGEVAECGQQFGRALAASRRVRIAPTIRRRDCSKVGGVLSDNSIVAAPSRSQPTLTVAAPSLFVG